MYDWLRQKYGHLSVAELSIWYTITAVASFIAIFLLWGLCIGLAGEARDENLSDMQMILLLVTLSLWLAFVIWLWVGLVRTAWKWGSHKLGTPIFKYLQIGFFVVTVFTALHRSDLRENLNILSLVLLGFDVAIVIMIFNFLLLAWFARCKIPFRAYGQIGSIVLMIVIQVWVFLQTSRS